MTADATLFAPPVVSAPAAPRAALRSYDNLSTCEAEVWRPRSWAALSALLQRASRQGRRICLRGAGASFHDHALGDDVVALTGDLPGGCWLEGDRLIASPAATYGEAMGACMARGRALAVAPTGSRITLGGGVAADVLSRFSQRWGKAADSVVSLELLTPDGQFRHITRDDPAFGAILGGFGQLGVITSVEMRTIETPAPAPGEQLRVVSDATFFRDIPEAVAMVVDAHRAANAVGASARRDPAAPVTWALVTPTGHGTVFASRFAATDRPLRSFIAHRPQSLDNWIGNIFCATSSWWSKIGTVGLWWQNGALRRQRTFVGSVEGFTFMMDGHWRARRSMQRAGLRPWLLQQSFALPIPAAGDGAAPTLAFIGEALERAKSAGLPVDMIDLLTLPADDRPLSASRGQDMLVASVAFQGLRAETADRVRALLIELSTCCADLGGRVHLTKAVHAEPGDLARMYGEGYAAFAAQRRRLDPQGVLASRFHDRLRAAMGRG